MKKEAELRLGKIILKKDLHVSTKILKNFGAFCVAILIFPALYANPIGGNITAGNAIISSPNATTVEINQTSNKAIIEWNSFNIKTNEKTRFQQPSTNAVTLNRINPTQGVSQIFGNLSANGRIILVNQAGIFFGPHAYVNVGGIIASTSNISNENFLAGKYVFDQPSLYSGSIVNKGTIIANQSGLVALIGSAVQNDGTIVANLGTVALASGDKFTFDFAGDQLINFSVDAPATKAAVDEHGSPIKDSISNKGKIIANGGKIIMTANAAKDVLNSAINMSGILVANTVKQKNGVIILSADNGTVNVSGKILASGKQFSQKGGSVKVLAKNIILENKAKINVSGNAGGGEVLIGGDYQGKNPAILNADTIFVGSDVKIYANALKTGDGGKVIVWGNNSARFYGSIIAKGGPEGGNGGFAETSGGYLDTSGAKINLSASKGRAGTWLLDPADLTISASPTANPAPFTPSYTADNNSNTSTVNVLDLTAALVNNDVVIQTTAGGIGTGSGNITVATPITWASAHSLALISINNITINAASAITMSALGSSFIMNLAGTGTQSSIIAGLGSFEKQGAGTFTLSQLNTYTGGTIASGGTLNASVLTAVGSNVGTGGITINNGSTFSYTGATATAPAARTFTIGSGGGTIRATSATGATLTIAGGIAISGNALTIDTIGATPANITISTNPISGAATGSSVTKTGAGSLNMGIASTYGSISSATNVNGGTLLNGATNALPVTTALTVGASGIYNMNNFIQTIGSLVGSGTIRNTGATSRILTVGDSNSTIFSGTLGNAGGLNFGLTKQGTGALTVSGTSAYIGATLISAGVLQSGATNAFSSASAFTVTGTLDLNSFAQTIGSLAGAGTVTLSAGLTEGGNNTSTIFSGLLNGSGSFTKTGTGTTTLSGAAAGYTGITNINAGTLSITTNANALGTGAVNIIPTGATASTLSITNLAIANAINMDSTNAATTLSGTGTQTYTSLINLIGTNNLISPATSITLNNIISGSGVLIKAGAGALLLSGLNTYTGKTSVTAGTLSFNTIANVGGGSSALGAPTTIVNGTIDLSGTLTYTGTGHSTNRVINLTNTSTITGGAAGALTLNGDIIGSFGLTLTGTSPSSSILNGKINTGSTLTKSGTGTWILAGDNASAASPYTTTNITQGTLQIGNGGTSGTLGTGVVTDTGALVFNRSDNITVNNAISGAGALRLDGLGIVKLGSTSNSYSGATTLNAGTLQAGGINTFSPNTAFTFGTVTANALDLNDFDNIIKSLAGGLNFGEVKLGSVTGGALTIQNTANTSYSGTISGLGGVTINAPGFGQAFVGSNTYTGATLVNAGTLTLSNLNALGSGSNKTVSIAVNSGATLTMNVAGQLSNNTATITLNGAGVGGNGNLIASANAGIIANPITLNADTTIGGANTLTLSGVITGSAALIKEGANTITLSNANFYNDTTINTGILAITNPNALGTGGNIAINNAATLSINLSGNALANSNTITMSGTSNLTSTVAAALTDVLNNAITLNGTTNTITSSTTNGTLSLANNITNNTSTVLVFTGSGNITQAANANTLSGAGNISKTGTGIFMLNNANTYTGPTSVTAGTLSFSSLANANGTSSALGAPNSIANGTITLGAATLLYTGTGHSTDRVINLTGAGVLTASGSGTLTLNSNGSTNGMTGIQNLTLNGSGAGLINSVIATGGGALTKSGTGTWTLASANIYSGLTTVSAGTLQVSNASGLGDTAGSTTIAGGTLLINNVALANEAIQINNGATLASTGTVSIPGVITFGGTNAARTISALTGTDTLSLSSALNGAFNLAFGGSGTITLNNALGGTTPLTSLTSTAPLILSNGTVTTTGTQTYNGAVTLGANGTFTTTNSLITFGSTLNRDATARTLTTNSGSSGVTFTGNVGAGVNGALGAMSLTTTGTTTITGTVAAASLSTGSGGNTLNTSSITTSGSQAYNGAVTLATIAKNLTSTGDAITFNSTITGAFGLTLSGNTGVAFGGAVGATALTSLDITVPTTALNANVTTTGTQSYHSAITLGGNATLTTTNNAVTVDSTIDSVDATPRNLTISTGNAAINLAGDLGATNALGALTLNTIGTGTLSGTVNADSLVTNASGTTNLNGSTVTTSGIQTYGDAVVLGANTTLNTINSLITFSSTVNRDATAARTLTTNSGLGGVTFTGNVGAGANGALGAIALNTSGTSTITGTLSAASLTTDTGGTTALNGSGVTTGGAQLYNDAVTLNNASTILNASDLTFGNTLNSLSATARPLTINASGTTTFSGAVGSTFALSTLTISATGATAINGGSIRTSGTQTFNNAVALGQNTTFTVTSTASILLPNILNSFTFTPTFAASSGTLTNVSLSNASSSAIFPIFSSTPTNLTLNFSAAAVNFPALTLGGTLTVTSGGNITQSGALVITGVTTASVGSNNITLGNAVNNFGTIILTANNANIADMNAVILGASTLTGNLSVTAGGTITDSGVISANTLTTTSIGGATLDAAGGATANIVANFNASNSGGGVITLVDNVPTLTVTGINQTGTTVNLTNTGTLAVADGEGITTNNTAINIRAKDLNLNSTGFITSGSQTTTITQNFAGGSIGVGNASGTMAISGAELQRITANTLTLTTTTSNGQIFVDGVTANNTANINLLSLIASGTAGSISFNNNASIFKALTATAANGITINKDLTTTAGALTLTANTGGALILNGVNLSSGTTMNLAGNSSGGAQLTGSALLTVGTNFTLNSAVTGAYDFSIDTNGGITINRSISVANLVFNAGTLIGINGNNPITTTGDQTYTASNTMDIGAGITLTGRNITLNTDISGSGQHLLLNGQPGSNNNFIFNGTVGVEDITITGNTAGDNSLSVNVAQNNSWLISGANQGSIANTGVTGNFTFANIGNLTGGSNDDTFTFSSGSTLSGIVNGGNGGVNTLDFASYATLANVHLIGSTSFGYTGTTEGTPNPTGGFANITQISGVIVSALQGTNTSNIWTINDSNTGTINDSTATLAFLNFGNLIGGNGDDTFAVGNSGSIGTLNGGSGSNGLSYLGDTRVVSVNLFTNTATAVNSFSNITNFVGDDGTIGTNSTLIANNANNSWRITGANAGTINTNTFSGFGNLTGGNNADTFIFNNATRVTGLINGTNLASANTLNYLSYAPPIKVTLFTATSGKVQNANKTVITNFININNILSPNPSPPVPPPTPPIPPAPPIPPVLPLNEIPQVTFSNLYENNEVFINSAKPSLSNKKIMELLAEVDSGATSCASIGLATICSKAPVVANPLQ
jgi:autotransporter-associated beta strand protein